MVSRLHSQSHFFSLWPVLVSSTLSFTFHIWCGPFFHTILFRKIDRHIYSPKYIFEYSCAGGLIPNERKAIIICLYVWMYVIVWVVKSLFLSITFALAIVRSHVLHNSHKKIKDNLRLQSVWKVHRRDGDTKLLFWGGEKSTNHVLSVTYNPHKTCCLHPFSFIFYFKKFFLFWKKTKIRNHAFV